jgi:Tol biopolymer transport system component
MVLFIDNPRDEGLAQVYGVNINQVAANPAQNQVSLVYETIGFRSPDQTIVARPDPNNRELMLFTNEQTGESWTVNTDGNWPIYSPDGTQIFWNATDRDGPYDQRRTDIWLAEIDGRNARLLLTIYGGGVESWFPDGQHLLITGRADRIGEEEVIFALSIEDGSTMELGQEKRLRAGEISKDGTWVIYFSSFADDPAYDGLFAVRADGSERRKLDFLGPFRWRDDTHLLYIPTRAVREDSLVVWEMDMERGESYPLTDPAQIRFVIDGGDWALSPDGKKLVFVSAEDKNLWLITLP